MDLLPVLYKRGSDSVCFDVQISKVFYIIAVFLLCLSYELKAPLNMQESISDNHSTAASAGSEDPALNRPVFSSQRYNNLVTACESSTPNQLSPENAIDLDIKYDRAPHRNENEYVLSHKDVCLSIMAIWAGLGEIKYPYTVTFAADGFTAYYADDFSEKWFLPRTSDAFILPLEFHKESDEMSDDDDNTVRFHVLVLCEPESEGGSGMRVNILRSFSGDQGQPDDKAILERVRSLVEGRWGNLVVPEKEINSERVWHWIVPQATEEYEKYHVVLNAWAYLLDIPTKPSLDEDFAYDDFYQEAFHLFDLALQGRLDYETIECFLQESGYAYGGSEAEQYQCIENKYRSNLRRFRSVEINNTLGPSKDWSGRLWDPTRSGPVNPEQPVSFHSDESSWRKEFTACYEIDKGGREPRPFEDGDLIEDDVFAPIAAVWKSLWDRRVRFGFGTPVCFQATGAMGAGAVELGEPAIGGWKRFIMPIVLSKEEVKSETGHWVLGVARVTDGTASTTIKVDIYDSLNSVNEGYEKEGTDPNTIGYRPIVVERVSNIIQHSGWLTGVIQQDNGSWTAVPWPAGAPKIESIEFHRCLQQVYNRCGHHVILNAWATMLQLEISDRTDEVKNAWYNQARKLFRLAVEGRLRLRTIQAYLNACGFVVRQPLSAPAYAGTTVDCTRTDDRIDVLLLEWIREAFEARAAGVPGA